MYRLILAALCAVCLAFAAGAPARADVVGLVQGEVTLRGRPAADAAVRLAGSGTDLRTTTDTSGAFALGRVPFGRYTLTVTAAGVPAATQAIEVQTDAIVRVGIELEPKTIGRTQTTSARGPGAEPVSVNTIGSTQIAASPENESLNRLTETLPGIVRFSYDEPVAHGFHGLSYELDGVPLPRSTSSNFSEIVDPRDVDSLEVFTGAFPAEYGGQRQGAVVNLTTRRMSDLALAQEGTLTFGFGTNVADDQAEFTDALREGNTAIFLDANTERTSRGLDSPTFDPIHDASNRLDEFVRTVTRLNARDTLAVDVSNAVSHFEIPISPTANTDDPVINASGTDDVESEYASSVAVSLTDNAKNGEAYTQIVPWYRSDRVAYGGDSANDLASVIVNSDGSTTPLDSLTQDRGSTFYGLRLTHFHVFGSHAVKAGIDDQVENFRGTESIDFFDTNGNVQTFADDSSQRGTNVGAYIEDKWTPLEAVSLFGGLRYDHSTGYVGGSQLSPRLEFDARLSRSDVFHAYYGRLYAAPTLEDTRLAAVVTSGGPSNELPAYDLQPERDTYIEFGLAHQIAPFARAYVNVWKRNVVNVLDTTQLAETPLFAVFNNAVGIAKGIDARLESTWRNGDAIAVSATVSQSLAGGISGGTFLFCPPPATAACTASNADLTLQPEDHDQTVAVKLAYTKRFGAQHEYFASLEPEYGTGYPVEFQDGNGRLPAHLTADASFGRDTKRRDGSRGIGFVAEFANITNDAYLIKVNNGFNTTQWAPGFRADFRITAPF